MVPFTYNFELFKRSIPSAEIQLKIGYMGQFNFVAISDEGTLPEYSISKFSHGFLFGFSAYPLKLGNSLKLGIFLDAYRGSRIYTDFYNQESFEMPGSSFIKAGIRYRFK
jgi:hypothetical protein